MSVVACILARNNEMTILDAVHSISHVADRVLVLDTGSTDTTCLLAAEAGAEVYFFPWIDDFSAARNEAIRLAGSAEWIWMLDSDEVYQPIEHKEEQAMSSVRLSEWLSKLDPNKQVGILECQHYTDHSFEQMLSITHAERLFNPAIFQYEGNVHERLVRRDEGLAKEAVPFPLGVLRHVGYDAESRRHKSRRNLKLLKRDVYNPSIPGMNSRYLATEMLYAGEYVQCLALCIEALRALPRQELYSRAQTHYCRITAYLTLGHQDRALEAISDCIQDIPQYPDPYAIAGELYFAREDWEVSLLWYEKWQSKRKEADRGSVWPDHCVTMREEVLRHRQVARLHAGHTRFAHCRTGEKRMRIAVLITQVELEYDLPDLIRHLQAQFGDLLNGIAIWTESKHSAFPDLASLRQIQAATVQDATATLARLETADYVWVWEGGERLVHGETLLSEGFEEGGRIEVCWRSERLCIRLEEQRVFERAAAQTVPVSVGSESEVLRSDAHKSDRDHEKITKSAALLIKVERPLVLKHQLANQYAAKDEIAQTSEVSDLKDLLLAFGSGQYKKVMASAEPSEGHAQWIDVQYLKILAAFNLGNPEEASARIYRALDMELDQGDYEDFAYLYARLAANVSLNEMKREAIELLGINALQDRTEGSRTGTKKAERLALAATLYGQLQETEEALMTWRSSLKESDFRDQPSAYRMAELLQEVYAEQGREAVARAVLEAFRIPEGTHPLVYPIFMYLGMPEWALLFRPYEEVRDLDQLENLDSLPLVSIVLPVYNDAKYLKLCIRSVLAQTYPKLELLIVDDGSEQQIARMVETFRYDTRVQYRRLESNRGLPAALNIGLEMAKGELMGWTSADNYAHPRWLEEMVAALESNPEVGGVFSDYYHVDEDGLVIETKRLSAYRVDGLRNAGPSFIWRASLLARIGHFDETLFGIEDRDFSIRAALAAPLIRLPEPLYYYRLRRGSLSSRIESGEYGGWPGLHERLKRKWLYLSFT